ncbi:MAG: hypothetical protein ABIU95_09840, partial [Burkholderiales bacterium]
VPSASVLPDGIERKEIGSFKWASFVREGHPAVKGWGRKAWGQWPHLVVRVGLRIASPVDVSSVNAAQRTIGAWVPHFSAVAPMPHRIVWSIRLGNDPAVCWIRDHLEQVLAEILAAADTKLPR